ncbi:MAG: hypothetical protein ACREID_00125, partial [Planctomycetota bacterium]
EETLAAAGSLGRAAAAAGVRADTQASRWYGSTLHLVNVSLEYEDLYALSDQPTELFPLDAVDRVTRFEQIGLRLRNRLRRRAPTGELRTVLDVEVLGLYFPGGQAPEGVAADGFVELDAEWEPREGLRFALRAGADAGRGTLDTGSFEGSWRARSDILLAAGFRHLDGDSDIFTNAAEFDVDTRWRIVLFSQLDAKSSDFLDQGILVQRLGQTVVVGFRVGYDPGDNELSFAVKVDLLAAFRRERARHRAGDDLYSREQVGWR